MMKRSVLLVVSVLVLGACEDVAGPVRHPGKESTTRNAVRTSPDSIIVPAPAGLVDVQGPGHQAPQPVR